jgi:hypothetical protein
MATTNLQGLSISEDSKLQMLLNGEQFTKSNRVVSINETKLKNMVIEEVSNAMDMDDSSMETMREMVEFLQSEGADTFPKMFNDVEKLKAPAEPIIHNVGGSGKLALDFGISRTADMGNAAAGAGTTRASNAGFTSGLCLYKTSSNNNDRALSVKISTANESGAIPQYGVGLGHLRGNGLMLTPDGLSVNIGPAANYLYTDELGALRLRIASGLASNPEFKNVLHNEITDNGGFGLFLGTGLKYEHGITSVAYGQGLAWDDDGNLITYLADDGGLTYSPNAALKIDVNPKVTPLFTDKDKGLSINLGTHLCAGVKDSKSTLAVDVLSLAGKGLTVPIDGSSKLQLKISTGLSFDPETQDVHVSLDGTYFSWVNGKITLNLQKIAQDIAKFQ